MGSKNLLLFSDQDIFSVTENQKAAMRKAIGSFSSSQLNGSENLLVSELVQQFGLDVPVLRRETITASHREVQVDVRYDMRRFIINTSSPAYMTGTEITIHVPFSGEKELFRIQPSSFSLNPPQGVIHDHELCFVYEIVPDTHFDVERDYKQRLSSIETYLASLKSSASLLHDQLHVLARSEIEKRRKSLQSSAAFIESLNIPVRTIKMDNVERVTPIAAKVQRHPPLKSQEWGCFYLACERG